MTDGGRGGADGRAASATVAMVRELLESLRTRPRGCYQHPRGHCISRPDDPAGLTAIVPKYTRPVEPQYSAKSPFSARKTRVRCQKTTCDPRAPMGRMGGAWYGDGGGGPRLPTGGRRADHAAARMAALPRGRMPGRPGPPPTSGAAGRDAPGPALAFGKIAFAFPGHDARGIGAGPARMAARGGAPLSPPL